MIFALETDDLLGELGDTYAGTVMDSYRSALDDDANLNQLYVNFEE